MPRPEPQPSSASVWSARRRVSVTGAFSIIVACLAACGAASPKAPTAPPGAAADIPAAVAANNAFALAMMRPLARGGGNVVFSPYSIETALAMVDAGAAGSTATEIDHVLHTNRPAAVAAGLAAVTARLTTASQLPRAPQVHLADGLWVQSGLALRKPFTQTLSARFRAPPQAADFTGAPDTARQNINSWVAARTDHLIADLFPAGTITSQTRLVLANAIYLDTHWEHPFTSTAPGPFYPAAGPMSTAQFMTEAPVRFAYARGRGYQAVELPYVHSSLSMLVIMPATGTLARFEPGLSTGSLARLEHGLRPTMVRLEMPRFTLTLDTGLTPVLAQLGMPVAFTSAADFSGITTKTKLKISAVEHDAYIRVDQQGTLAAAATGIAVGAMAVRAPPPALLLTINHPFLVFLRDDATGAILFAAQVTDPAALT